MALQRLTLSLPKAKRCLQATLSWRCPRAISMIASQMSFTSSDHLHSSEQCCTPISCRGYCSTGPLLALPAQLKCQLAMHRAQDMFKWNRHLCSQADPKALGVTVRLFDEADTLLGEMNVHKARNIASKKRLNLLFLHELDGIRQFRLVNGKQLQEARMQHKQKATTEKRVKQKSKTLRLSSRIAPHDLDLKLRQAEQLLRKNVQVELMLSMSSGQTQQEISSQQKQFLQMARERLTSLASVRQARANHKHLMLVLQPSPQAAAATQPAAGTQPGVEGDLQVEEETQTLVEQDRTVNVATEHRLRQEKDETVMYDTKQEVAESKCKS